MAPSRRAFLAAAAANISPASSDLGTPSSAPASTARGGRHGDERERDEAEQQGHVRRRPWAPLSRAPT